MEIYISVIAVLLFSRLLFKDNKKYCIFCFCLLSLLLLYKDPYIGADNKSLYIPSFNRIIRMSYEKVLYNFKDTDVFFYVCTKLFTNYVSNLNLYFFVCGLPLLYAVSKFIYKYSKNPVLSFILFFTMFYGWGVVIVRHSMAWGFILLAIDAFLDKKNAKFVILSLIATLFHKTALVIFLLPILSIIRNNQFKTMLVLAAFTVCYFLSPSVKNIIFSFITDGHFLLYSSRNITLSIYRYLLYIVFYFVIRSNKKAEYIKENYKLQSIYWVGCIILSFGFVVWDFYRMAMYFLIVLIAILPNWLEHLNPRTKRFLTFVLCIVLIIYGIDVFKTVDIWPYKLVSI